MCARSSRLGICYCYYYYYYLLLLLLLLLLLPLITTIDTASVTTTGTTRRRRVKYVPLQVTWGSWCRQGLECTRAPEEYCFSCKQCAIEYGGNPPGSKDDVMTYSKLGINASGNYPKNQNQSKIIRNASKSMQHVIKFVPKLARKAWDAPEGLFSNLE